MWIHAFCAWKHFFVWDSPFSVWEVLTFYLLFLQLFFEAYDLGVPSLNSTGRSQVTVNVLRNRAPFFLNQRKTAVVEENKPEGFLVADFNARDPDSGVSIETIELKLSA